MRNTPTLGGSTWTESSISSPRVPPVLRVMIGSAQDIRVLCASVAIEGTLMAIRNFCGAKPTIDSSAFIDPTALVIGDVDVGADVFVLPYVVIRGDVNTVNIGAACNIQDGSVLHVNSDSSFAPGGAPLDIGAEITIGHKVLLHGCRIDDHCLIGMGSTVMDRAIIERDVILGAGSLVTPGKHLRSGFLYAGSPVRQIRPLTDKDIGYIDWSYKHYRKLKEQHRGLA